jgi:hypothetical protein
MKSPTIERILVLALLIILGLTIKKCSDKSNDYSGIASYTASLSDTIRYLKNGIAKKPAVEITRDVFDEVLKERDDLRAALKKAEIKARNVRSVTSISSKIETEPITITMHDTVLKEGDPPVFVFDADSTFYHISGMAFNNKLILETIDFPDSMVIITADKPHFFKPNEYFITVSHSNPLIKTTGMENLTIYKPNRWWNSTWAKLGLGVVGGVVISQKLLK